MDDNGAIAPGGAPAADVLVDRVAAEPRKRPFVGKTCFVIMPFGTKRATVDGLEVTFKFDEVFNKIIEPAVHQDLGLTCIRSDKVSRSGLIHKDMIEHIVDSDAVVVDVTLHNPNVFYELGVRHTARRSGTVIIRLGDYPIPFNINGLRIFDYSVANDEEIKASRDALSANVAGSLAEQSVDSLVYSLMGNRLSIQRVGKPIRWRDQVTYRHHNLGDRSIGIVTGDICHIDFIDVWLNPENTRMQMGRMHDESLSACVRYMGGRKNVQKVVVRDSIADELLAKVGTGGHVEAGHVVVTGPGNLARDNKVRLVVHAAAMHGEPTKGYQLIRNYPSCITNAMAEIDRLNSAVLDGLRLNPHRGKLRSLLIPLFGTRDRWRDPLEVADNLVLAATNYLEDHPKSGIQRVFFLAFTDIDKDLCETALRMNEFDIGPSS